MISKIYEEIKNVYKHIYMFFYNFFYKFKVKIENNALKVEIEEANLKIAKFQNEKFEISEKN